MADIPVFVSEDADEIIQEMTEFIEAGTGKVLSPADIEAELIQAWAYREKNMRIQLNNTARQNMVAFATGAALDQLGLLVDVTRLPAQGALCTIQLLLVAGAPATSFPDGIRFQSKDGAVIFITTQSVSVTAGTLIVNVPAVCTTPGVIGNNYAIGDISILLDPKPYLASGANIDVPTGGADDESDDSLRQRIQLAPNTFSVAGPREAYEYFAKSANPNIVAVDVSNPTPGTVQICPLMTGGEVPGQEILDAVMSVCNDEKVRPLTDTVVVVAPDKIDYDLDIDITLYSGADDDSTITTIKNNINNYIASKINLLGADIIISQIIGLCYIAGQVYNVKVNSPASDVIVGNTQFAHNTGLNVNVTGYNEG